MENTEGGRGGGRQAPRTLLWLVANVIWMKAKNEKKDGPLFLFFFVMDQTYCLFGKGLLSEEHVI